MGAKEDAFRLKWHRARMYEKGMSREAVQRKIGQLQTEKKLPKSAMLSDSVRAAGKKTGSPYRRWVNSNNRPSARAVAPDNGKSPWRNFADKGGAKKIVDKLDLGHDERQARYKANRAKNAPVANLAVQRAIERARRKRNKNFQA